MVVDSVLLEFLVRAILSLKLLVSARLQMLQLLVEHINLLFVAHTDGSNLILATLFSHSEPFLTGLSDALHLCDARFGHIAQLLLVLFFQFFRKLFQSRNIIRFLLIFTF